ncbi:MAG: DUF4249 domain-containing protein [Flavitalea sp.]
MVNIFSWTYTGIRPQGLWAIALALALGSCEKVINIPINNATKRMVIEGTISDAASEPATVRISTTNNVTDENVFEGVSGATVTIQENNVSVYTLNETSAGVYQSTAFTGIPGAVYTMVVFIGGQSFRAVSTLPQLVPLEDVIIDEFVFGSDVTKTIIPSYHDPAGKGNSYRFVVWVNGMQDKGIYAHNDDLSDGKEVTRPLPNSDNKIKTGDSVKVEMQCIDQQVYDYWYSLGESATGENQSATPANPVSNISGEALGYFSAYSTNSKTIIVP